MDRHDVSETVTAEIVAGLHQEDLKIEHKFGCRGLTYWFDDKRKTAFCLIEAKDKQNIIDMHNHAHGEVPHRIIEVDGSIVESFLGRIEDPEKAQNTNLNIINDPAFRTIMIVKLHQETLNPTDSADIYTIFNKQIKNIKDLLLQSGGNIVKHEDGFFLISYKSVSDAVSYALKIQTEFNKSTAPDKYTTLKIGLNAGVPVTNKNSIFEDTIKLAESLCETNGREIVMTSEVRDLYISEKMNTPIDNRLINVLTKNDEKFVSKIMGFVEEKWRDTNLKVDDFSSGLGQSKSQLYRNMMSVFGKSPNSFLKNFRLNQAKKLLSKQRGNISEIAFETGFSSPSYFSKCFLKKYGIIPSDFLVSRTVAQ